MVSVKQKRLEGIIRKNISEIIQFGVKDPDVGFVTITDVQVSNDHSYAKVFVTFLGQNPRMQAGLRALNRAAGFIRSELSKRMTIRRVPELSFVIDETEKTIKTLTSDVDVTLHHTNELLAKVNVLADDINVKVATIDPLFSAVADLSLSVSDLNDHARVLSKKASSAGSKTLKTGASLSALRVASKFFKK